jgi:small-conductance mechanosensitive channel
VSRRAPGSLAALLGLALLLAGPASAQSPAAPRAPEAAQAGAPGAPPAPEPLPGAEVADRAQEDLDLLERLEQRSRPEPAIEEIEAQLEGSGKELAGMVAKARDRLGEDATRVEIERVSFDFDRLRERLATWSAMLTKRAEAFDADLAFIAERRAVWRATRAKAAADSQPVVVLSRVDKTLAALDRAEKAVRARRNQILTTREGVARQQSAVEKILDLVGEVRAQRRKSLFALDRPPLWEAMRRPEPAQGGLLERLRASRANDLSELAGFARDRTAELLLLGLLGALSVFAAIAFRESARRLAEQDESLAAPASIFERPISTGIVIGTLATAALLPKAPPAYQGLNAVVLLVATLRLLTPLIEPELRRILYGLTAWYAIDRLRDRLVPDPYATRLAVLATALVAVAAFLWLLRPKRVERVARIARHGAWLRVIGVGMRLGLLLSAVSIVANVIGNTTLAEILVEGTLAASLLAFVFYASARVLEGSWALLLRTPLARSLRMVRNYGPLLQRRGRSLIRAGLTLWWLHASLRNFDAAEPARAAIASVLAAQWGMGELSLSLGGVLAFWLMIAASILLSRFVRFALDEDVLPRASLPRGVPFAISTLVRYAILLIGFAMAVLAAGFDMSRLALMLGALGVGIGIGLQDIVNNVVSGLILLFERPVQVGDIVDVENTRGEVRRIGIRSSTVRSFEGAELVIPNSKLVSATFVNWTLSDRQRRIEVPVGVAYGSDPDRVMEVLQGALEGRPELLQQPPPCVLFQGFGESSLDFLVRGWTPEPDTALVLRSQMVLDIHRALREAGIEIPFPQRDLHLRSVDRVAGRALAGQPAPGPEEPPAAGSGSG